MAEKIIYAVYDDPEQLKSAARKLRSVRTLEAAPASTPDERDVQEAA